MDADVKKLVEEAKVKMNKAIDHLKEELTRIRAGKASPNILDGVTIDYYGVKTPLHQVSTITTPDPKTIVIQPWEKNLLPIIEKAILAANLGFTPVNTGDVIRINMPPLTEERRKALVKQVKSFGENTKVSIRNIRRDFIETLRKLKKEGLEEDLEKLTEEEIQKITDNNIKKVDEMLEAKEQEIMKV